MKFISEMILKAGVATGENHELRVVALSDAVWEAIIVPRSGDSDDAIALESDWDVLCVACGDSIALAIDNLEAICAQDFS